MVKYGQISNNGLFAFSHKDESRKHNRLKFERYKQENMDWVSLVKLTACLLFFQS